MEPKLSPKEIHSTITGRAGVTLPVIYRDIDTEDELGERHIAGVHAYCFYQDKLLVVFSEEGGYWTPAGGGVEEGESAREAAIREVHEESNMKVLAHRFIGYQDIIWPDRIETQTRSVCLVEPYGDFVSDPDGDITEIRLIDPKDFKDYFDWGIIGDHIMERALEIKKSL